jgi:hypothetical protein
LRDVVLIVGLIFCVAFAGMTATVAAQSGLDIFIVISFAIVVMLMAAILGALRNPPE